MEIAFVQADDDDDDDVDVRLRKENSVHTKAERFIQTRAHTCIDAAMDIIWPFAGLFSKIVFTSLIRNKRSGCINSAAAEAFSMKHQFVVRLSFNVFSVYAEHTMKKWSEENQTKQKGNVTNKQKGVWYGIVCCVPFQFGLSFCVLFPLGLAYSIILKRSCYSTSTWINFTCVFSLSLSLHLHHSSVCFFRFICTICSALLFAVVGFIFQLLSSLEFCWTFSKKKKTKRHKHTHTHTAKNELLFSSLFCECRKLCKSIWMERI